MTNVSAWKRSIPLQEKAIENLGQQIRNVSSGRTADGMPGALRPLRAKEHAIENATPDLRRVLCNLAYYTGEPLSDEMRTAIIWKYLSMVCRGGDDALSIRLDLVRIAWFLASHPRYISGKAGMPAIRQQAGLAHERLRKRVEEQKFQALAARLREATKPPPRPILWHDGEYRLESLIHPFHLWEEGIARGNCLGRIVITRSDNHPANTITPETLSAIAYWRKMQTRKAEIYSMFKGSARRGLIMVNRTRILDTSSIGDKIDRDVLMRAVHEIRASRGLGQFNRDGRKR